MGYDWIGFERSYKSHLITDAMLRDATMTKKKKTKTEKSVGCSVKSMDRADGVLSSNFVCFYRSALGLGFAFGKTKRLFIFSSPCHWMMEYQSETRDLGQGRKMIQIDTFDGLDGLSDISADERQKNQNIKNPWLCSGRK